MRKMSIRKVKRLSQGYSASRLQRWDLNPGILTSFIEAKTLEVGEDLRDLAWDDSPA